MSAVIHPDVIAMARDGEPERYLAATLSPADKRADLIALAAFAADLRRIPLVVKEPMMGEVRLQWWRDVIDAFDRGESTGHPIADALGVAVRRHRLPKLSLIAMTESRAFDLYDDPMPDAAAFNGYLTKTEAIPFELALAILGSAPNALALADLAARSFGHARLLACLPHWLSRGRMPFAGTELKAQRIDVQMWRDSIDATHMRDLSEQHCREIEIALAALRVAIQSSEASARFALLPVATVPSYLKAIRMPGRDPLRQPAETSALSRVIRIGRARWLGL